MGDTDPLYDSDNLFQLLSQLSSASKKSQANRTTGSDQVPNDVP